MQGLPTVREGTYSGIGIRPSRIIVCLKKEEEQTKEEAKEEIRNFS